MSSSRNLTVDVARGCIVLVMPAVHTALFYSANCVKGGPLGLFLRCFAEGPGAQLFMFLMGFSIVLSRRRTPKEILRRSLVLFGAAYALNFLKFILPSFFGLIPAELLASYGISNDIFGLLDLFFIGDILQFAAISYLLCGLLYLWKYGFYIAGLLGSFIVFCSPLFWGYSTHLLFVDIFVRLFNGVPPAEFFPFFPWAAYPLIGLFCGNFFLRLESSLFYSLLMKAGWIFVVLGLILSYFEPVSYNSVFYRLGPGGTIFHIGIVFLWIRLCYEFASRRPNSMFVRLLSYLSRRITYVYIVQWILICWLLSFFGFNNNNLFKTVLEIVGISLLTFLIVRLVEGMANLNVAKTKF